VSPDPPSAPVKTVEAATESPDVRAPRSLDIANNNVLFRLFIWRDMLEDLKWEWAWWSGVGWEYPQRSPSLEILNWATVEWRRDGWITPHNSFLHMIYRGGIVGAGVVAALLAALVCFTRRFLHLKSVEGGLLMAVLMYWLGLANFLVFLELPYSAIPFWSLFGMIAAYLKHLEHHHRAGLQAQNP
jgi:O-antigen ligase